MYVTLNDIRQALQDFGLAGQPLCVHSSLRSFWIVKGGAATILDGLLAEKCTVLVPTFSYSAFSASVPADPALRPARNGWNYEGAIPWNLPNAHWLYTTDSREINKSMGAIPATVLAHPEHMRGNHPLNSFAAIGPLAQQLIAGQEPLHVYVPLAALVEANGWIVLMGVGLERMTFIHYAEQKAGRTLFRRWANGPDQLSIVVEVGGCSRGFGNFAPVLAPLKRGMYVGRSLWQIFPAKETLAVLVRAIQENPALTHCNDTSCQRCNDAVLGGPLLTPGM